MVQPKPSPTQAVPYAVSPSRASPTPSLRGTDCEAGQDFDDYNGTFIPYCGQLYHLRTYHEAARSAVLSAEPPAV